MNAFEMLSYFVEDESEVILIQVSLSMSQYPGDKMSDRIVCVQVDVMLNLLRFVVSEQKTHRMQKCLG